jgi:hypothetical protein
VASWIFLRHEVGGVDAVDAVDFAGQEAAAGEVELTQEAEADTISWRVRVRDWDEKIRGARKKRLLALWPMTPPIRSKSQMKTAPQATKLEQILGQTISCRRNAKR